MAIAEAPLDTDRSAPGMVRAALVLAVCFLLAFMGAGPVYYAYGNFALSFADDFGASRSVINIGFTMVSVLGNLGGAPIGMLADRIQIRYLACFGLAGTALGFVLISMSHGIWPIVVFYSTLVAMADVCLGVLVTNYIIAHWFGRRRGLALGISVMGTSAAGVLFPPLTDALIASIGWRETFLVFAAMLLAVLPLAWVFARLPHRMPEAEKVAEESEIAGRAMPLRAMLAMPAFWLLSVAPATVLGINTGFLVSLVTFAKLRGLTTAEGSYMISIMATCAVVGKAVFGALIDRAGYRIALQIGMTLSFAGCLALSGASAYWQMLAATMVFGVGLGAMLPVWGAAMAATVGLASYGRALGCSRVIWAPISMVFPIVAGWVFDRTGDYTWAWLIFALILFGPLVATLVWRPRPVAVDIPAPA